MIGLIARIGRNDKHHMRFRWAVGPYVTDIGFRQGPDSRIAIGIGAAKDTNGRFPWTDRPWCLAGRARLGTRHTEHLDLTHQDLAADFTAPEFFF